MSRKRKAPTDDDVTDDDVVKRPYAYSFTINNWVEDDKIKLEEFFKKHCRYMVFGEEIGEDKKTPHLQGHFDLKNAKTMSACQKAIQKFGFEKKFPIFFIKVSADHSREYAKKDGKFTEFGQVPVQGRRNDLNSYMEAVREKPNITKRETMEEFPMVYARYSRFCYEYKMICQDLGILQWTTPPNLWVHGPAGSGKSRSYQELDPPPFSKPINKWWDGYDGEDDVLIEDIDTMHVRMQYYIKIWADRYPFIAEVKGFSIKIRPKRIIITSNHMPDDIFVGADLEAIVRRFQLVKVG